MGRINVIIYDVDGTLLNTREWILGGFEHTAQKFGHPGIPRPQLAKLIGQSLESIYNVVCPGDDLDELFAEHRSFQEQNFDLVTAYDGAKEHLQLVSGKKKAIVTSRIGNLEETLDIAGITDFFDEIVTASQVQNHKPHPEGLLLALSALNAAPENALYIGDGSMDMEAAKRAHMTAVGITHGFGAKEDLLLNGADHIVNSFAEFSALIKSLDS